MNSTDTVSVLETRINGLQTQRELLVDDQARAKSSIRRLLLNAKIKSVDAEIDFLIEKKKEFE